jgi:uncharacterized protein YbjQ (UPF0145 family)
MQAEADAVDAVGIVGAQMEESSHGWSHHVIEYFAIGTAVAPYEGAPALEPPQLMLPMND